MATFRLRIENKESDGAIFVEVVGDDTIRSVKEKIAASCCFAADDIILFWYGDVLADDAILSRLDIMWEVTFHMTSKKKRSQMSQEKSSKRNRIQLPPISPVEKEYFRLCRIILDLSPVSEDDDEFAPSGSASSGVALPSGSASSGVALPSGSANSGVAPSGSASSGVAPSGSASSDRLAQVEEDTAFEPS
jgi:hypothetical protein